MNAASQRNVAPSEQDREGERLPVAQRRGERLDMRGCVRSRRGRHGAGLAAAVAAGGSRGSRSAELVFFSFSLTLVVVPLGNGIRQVLLSSEAMRSLCDTS